MYVTPVIPALGRKRQVGISVQGQPGVQTEFQDSQGYTEKNLSGKTKQQQKTKTNKQTNKQTTKMYLSSDGPNLH